MERNEFLKIAQQASAFDYDVTKEELIVGCGGIRYFPYSYEISFDKGVPIYRANLRDLYSNSIRTVDLEKIEKEVQELENYNHN